MLKIEELKKWNLIAGAKYSVSDLTDKIKELSKCQNNNVEIQRSLQRSIFKLFNRLNKLVDQSDLNGPGFAMTGQYEVETYWNKFRQEKKVMPMKLKTSLNNKRYQKSRLVHSHSDS